MRIQPIKMLICRESIILIDFSSGYPEHEVMLHYDNSHSESILRRMKFMKRQYSGYHFNNECKNSARGFMEQKHSYIVYFDFNNISKDKDDDKADDDDDKDALNKILSNLKVDIIAGLKDEAINNLKEIISDLKKEIVNE